MLLQHVMPHARRDNLHLFKTSTLLEADVQALAYYPLQRHALHMLPQLLTAHYLLPTTYELRPTTYYPLLTTCRRRSLRRGPSYIPSTRRSRAADHS
jgi:hypothetical protein